MKHLIFPLLLLLAPMPLQAMDDDARQALYGAVDSVKTSLEQAPFGANPVAILPIGGDDGTVASRLKNLLTQSGFVCVEGKDDPMWDEILKEIAWDERKNDILDADTIVQFGRLKASKILIYGNILALNRNNDRVYAEIELHATDLETKQHIWGGNFAYRYYKGNDVHGIVALDPSLRELLKKNFVLAKDSLLDPGVPAKLAEMKTVTVIPLAGDIDQYMTGLAIENLTLTNHTPKNPQIPSLSQVRSFIRDGQLGSDGIFYGAVRDLSRRAKPALDTETENAYEINADIQLFLENAKNGEVLWSRTITLQEMTMVEKELTQAEKDAIKSRQFWEANGKWFLLAASIVIGVIVLTMLVSSIRASKIIR